MDIMALSHKYKALKELIFQVDVTEIWIGFIEAPGEKHHFFFNFFYYNTPVFILIHQFT